MKHTSLLTCITSENMGTNGKSGHHAMYMKTSKYKISKPLQPMERKCKFRMIMVCASLELHTDSLHFSSAWSGHAERTSICTHHLPPETCPVLGDRALPWGEPSGDRGHRAPGSSAPTGSCLVLPDLTGILLFPTTEMPGDFRPRSTLVPDTV